MEIQKEIIGYLKAAHGAYNLLVVLLFVFQAGVGFRIRKMRQAATPSPALVKRHRKFGPLLAALAIAGYVFGLLLVLLDEGRVMKYPAHFACGSLIVLLVVALVRLSQRITRDDTLWRSRHALAGKALLFLYGTQIVLGLAVLF